MVVDAERRIDIRLFARVRQVIARIGQKFRQEALALRLRHQSIEQDVGEHPGLREHGGDVGVAGGELLDDDAAGEAIGSRAAGAFGKRERAQAELRGLIELVQQERPLARFQPIGGKRDRLQLARDKIANRVANLQLLGAQMQIVHCVFPRAYLAAIRPGCLRSWSRCPNDRGRS